MAFKPLYDKVLVKLDEQQSEEKTEGGLFLPDSAKAKPNRGIVVSVGIGKYIGECLVPPYLQPGQRVQLPEYGGAEVTLPGGKYFLFSEMEILGVFE